MLKNLLLVETYGITYLNKEKSASLYGSQAINGVVILQTSEKRFKAVRKKYGS
jgi:outer membrane cobalamin receptor